MDKDKTVQIVLLGAVAIDGNLQTRGAKLDVPEEVAKGLLARGKAELPTGQNAIAAIDERAKKQKATNGNEAKPAKDKA